jgi:hypothetical protein
MTAWNRLAAAALRQMAVPLVVTPSDLPEASRTTSATDPQTQEEVA